MNFFLYSTVSDECAKRLENLITTCYPKEKTEFYRSFDKFSQRLRQPVQARSIVVLVPSSREELQEILSRRDLLRDLRTIVITPDHEAETIAIAHQLRPRYLTYLDNDYHELAAVLSKMVAGHLPDQSG